MMFMPWVCSVLVLALKNPRHKRRAVATGFGSDTAVLQPDDGRFATRPQSAIIVGKMSDVFWKIFPALTLIAGYVGGVIKPWLGEALAEWRLKRKLRKALYSELGGNINQVFTAYSLLAPPSGEFNAVEYLKAHISFECFREAQKHSLVFHQLPEVNAISEAYNSMSALQSKLTAVSHNEIRIIMKDTFGSVCYHINADILNRTQLFKHLSLDTENFLKQFSAANSLR